MAEIVPFLGVHYNTDWVGSLDRLVSPPYDVISPTEQDALYAADPHNFVRIILNRSEPSDDQAENVYSRAARSLRSWLSEGVLVQDPEPAFYLYEQEFTDPGDGARRTRKGLFCALKLEPYSAGVVLPHEETRPKARQDRLDLMRATASNPEPILALYEDPRGELVAALRAAAEPGPMLEAAVDGDAHRVFRVPGAPVEAAARGLLQGKPVWIADGHHRYETALTYRGEVGAGLADHMMVVLSAFEDPGVVVLPTHRLVRDVPAERLGRLQECLRGAFDVEAVPLANMPAKMQAARPAQRFGCVTAEGALVLTLRDPAAMDAAGNGHAREWNELDVSVLHTLVLDRCLGIPEASLATAPGIAYTRDAADAIVRVHSGEFQAAFLLNQPAADEVRRVAAVGEKMPAKSTFFYPKLWSGLLLRLLRPAP